MKPSLMWQKHYSQTHLVSNLIDIVCHAQQNNYMDATISVHMLLKVTVIQVAYNYGSHID